MDEFNDTYSYSYPLFFTSPKYGNLKTELLQPSDYFHLRSYYSTYLILPKLHNLYQPILLYIYYKSFTVSILPPSPYYSTYSTAPDLLFLSSPPHYSTYTTAPKSIKSQFSPHYGNNLSLHEFTTSYLFLQYNIFVLFYLLCISLYIFTIWRDFSLIISPRSGEQIYVL